MRGAGPLWLALLVLVLAACGSGASDTRGSARTAFEAAVAKDTNILGAVPLPSDASAAQAQQGFTALASESLRFKGEVEGITYPDNAKADAAKFETDLGTEADIAQRISSAFGQVSAGIAPSDAPSQTEFCDATTQAVKDANALFNDLQSNQQYRAPGVGCA